MGQCCVARQNAYKGGQPQCGGVINRGGGSLQVAGSGKHARGKRERNLRQRATADERCQDREFNRMAVGPGAPVGEEGMLCRSRAVPAQALGHGDGAGVAAHEPESSEDCKRGDTALAHPHADEVDAVLEEARPIHRFEAQHVRALGKTEYRVENVHSCEM